ncbi:MAG: hypothetical protein QOD85_1450, partial [Gaiellaceae bacterium]|nr:hypothetical protein [Gaiellaceae bacterium]
DSTAARRRSTIESAVASETPAPSYVFPLPLPVKERSLEPRADLSQEERQSSFPAAS